MKYVLFCLLISLGFGERFSIKSLEDNALKVFVFLGEECVISQSYTLRLNELSAQYADQKVQFIGVFSNPYSSKESVEQFKAKYKISFECRLDADQFIMQRFEVDLNPMAVIYDSSQEKLLYRGRIDDYYYALGRHRPKVRSHDLMNALEENLTTPSESRIFVEKQAVGCIITPAKGGIKMCAEKNR